MLVKLFACMSELGKKRGSRCVNTGYMKKIYEKKLIISKLCFVRCCFVLYLSYK